MSESAPGARPRWRRLGLIALEIALVVGILLAARAWHAPQLADENAPAFHGERIDTEAPTPIRLADYRGQPLLLVFWAEWCPICRLELSTLASLAEDGPVLSVAMRSGHDAAVRDFLRKEGIQGLPVVNDPDGSLAALYGVKGVPVAFVLDGTGQIRFVETGLTSSWGLRARLWWAGRAQPAP